MTELSPLPALDPQELAKATPERLLELLIEHEDRATRPLFDVCLARGEAMVEALEAFFAAWDDPDPEMSAGQWWAQLHGIYLLGMLEGEAAGRLLARSLRQTAQAGDFNLLDWLSGDWPQLFANKPAAIIDQVRELAEDKAVDWYARCQAVDVVVDAALRRDAKAREAALDWVAAMAENSEDDKYYRYTLGNLLLDFPRERHRPLLEQLVEAQRQGPGWGMHFDESDVESAYLEGEDQPDWHRRPPILSFYDETQILKRQERWREEDERAKRRAEARRDSPIEDEEYDLPHDPYIREVPKLGRNDPCHCGSGKKYKKCCMAADEARESVQRSLL